MSRERHQYGRVELTGKRLLKWKGHYYIYERQIDGTEKRRHRAVILGLKSQMTKAAAEDRLKEIIDKKTGATTTHPSGDVTLGWFWKERFRPLKEPTWKASSAPKMVWLIQNYVVKPFETTPLDKLNRFELQTHLNMLASRFSRSVVVSFRTYVKAILDEALEQDFIHKNPARKLITPITRKSSRRTLAVEEIAQLLAHMDGRDRLIVRMFLVLGLRPGELFALRRNDRLTTNYLRIDQSVSPLIGIVEPKTDASCASVWMPHSLALELDFWMDSQQDRRPDAFLFPSRAGTPLSANNFLKRVLKKAGERTRRKLKESGAEIPNGFLESLTHQALRRSCATHMQAYGSVKDIQAHLRHSRPNVTAEIYMQSIPATVRTAVESLDQKLSAVRINTAEGSIEPN
ncbi:MAG: site-specific integrase [Bryobacteraceae bacterium]